MMTMTTFYDVAFPILSHEGKERRIACANDFTSFSLNSQTHNKKLIHTRNTDPRCSQTSHKIFLCSFHVKELFPISRVAMVCDSQRGRQEGKTSKSVSAYFICHTFHRPQTEPFNTHKTVASTLRVSLF